MKFIFPKIWVNDETVPVTARGNNYASSMERNGQSA